MVVFVHIYSYVCVMLLEFGLVLAVELWPSLWCYVLQYSTDEIVDHILGQDFGVLSGIGHSLRKHVLYPAHS